MIKKINISFSIVLFLLALIHLAGALITLFNGGTNTNSPFYSFSHNAIIFVYITFGLFILYMLVSLCSYFIKNLKGFFKIKYFAINMLAVLIATSGAIIYLYKIADGLTGF